MAIKKHRKTLQFIAANLNTEDYDHGRQETFLLLKIFDALPLVQLHESIQV